MDVIRPAVNRPRKGAAGSPSATAATAPVAMISTGTYRGKTSRDSNCPPRRRLIVRPAPMAPTRLRMGVPKASVATRTGRVPEGRFNHKASSGESSTMGNQATSQCASTLDRLSRASE